MNNINNAAEIIAYVFRPLMKGYADALGRDLAAQLHKEGLVVRRSCGVGAVKAPAPVTCRAIWVSSFGAMHRQNPLLNG